ncbi:MAG TPA: hypothetical protein VFL42_12075 [Terriglobales bacterium]|jgi:hypothetical protein|nr:hypothetical protein [Terriglobales bacterium]
MAQAAPNYEERQEFWKPVVSPRADVQAAAGELACSECGTEFIVGSRFCHICGAGRKVNLADSTVTGLRAWFDYASLRDALGQSTAPLVAFIIGCAFVIAAALTGVIFTANNLTDWQAIQLWRIEWLLAGVAAFMAGLLLKKKTA